MTAVDWLNRIKNKTVKELQLRKIKIINKEKPALARFYYEIYIISTGVEVG